MEIFTNQIAPEKMEIKLKQGDIGLLGEIARFESEHDMEKEYRNGWSWRCVRIWPATLSRLLKEGYIEMVYRSNAYTGYKLSDTGKKIVKNVQIGGNVFYPNPQLK